MMNRRPDLNVVRRLQYFEAVARHGSMQSAADELRVTASAVSHQLRELTRTVGEELFVRSGRGIALTDAGLSLAGQLADAFDILGSSIDTFTQHEQSRLRVAVCSAFGPFWLAPRLPSFVAAYPQIELELRLYAQDPEQSQEIADCIVTARPIKLGFSATDLFEESLVAVVSRDAATGSSQLPLITTDAYPDREGGDWRAYASSSGLDYSSLSASGLLSCTHYILALGLARAGAGIALVPDFLASEWLGEGSVVTAFPARVPSGRTYRLATKEARKSDPMIRRLLTWIRREVDVNPTGDDR